ncbi:MAG: hypothetical protein ACAI44_12245 [Candidatus Sericytochromatia bacterium]
MPVKARLPDFRATDRLADIRQLLTLENLDWEYLWHWARQLQINSFGYLDHA